MTSLSENIYQAEKKWLPLCTKYTRDIFQNVWLPSHDETHSLRTWSVARDLFHELEQNNLTIDRDIPLQALIAIFFHDTGMAVDPGVLHGGLSKRFCMEFFEAMEPDQPPGMKNILETIEKHDDKTYRKNSLTPATPVSLFNIVSICDDLDAFGPVGIFRYWEIYKRRGMAEEVIPGKVLKNINTRFNNFEKVYGFLGAFHNKHENRFLEVKLFYRELQEAFISAIPVASSPVRQIVELFNEQVLVNKVRPEKLMEFSGKSSSTEVRSFLGNFCKEF